MYRNILCIRFVDIKQPRFYECDHKPYDPNFSIEYRQAIANK